MSATSAPYGLIPVQYPQGRIVPKAIPAGIASGYATNIYLGSPVTIDTNGNVILSTTASDIAGVFAGCEYFATGASLEVKRQNWVSGTVYNTGTMITYIYDDPNITYKIQANGSLTQASVGDEADFANIGSGSGVWSTAQLGSLVGAGSQGQLRILGLAGDTGTAWGDAFTDVLVEIARHQRRFNKVAV